MKRIAVTAAAGLLAAIFACPGTPRAQQSEPNAKGPKLTLKGVEAQVVTLQQEFSTLAPAWDLTGNAGTTAGTDFIGTTDSQPFETHVKGARVMRYEPAVLNGLGNEAPNVLGGDANNSVAAGVQGATIAGGGGASSSSSVPVPNQVTATYSR